MIIQDFPNYSIFKDGTVVNNISGKQLKPSEDRYGYKFVGLYKNKRRFYFRVHRLLAIHFINNPQNLSYVNHKDEDKSNNSVDNLEWCTPSYNVNYGTRNIRMAQTQGHSIKAFKNGIFVGSFYSERKCARELNIDPSHVSKAVRGLQKTAGGYTFEYDI
ncbi:putative HNH endonuclease [Leuconostoc phage phiLN12]|uniref:Putative HNH endonuclease n=2 Tax=Limdunavirus TaxID=2169621 RepID=M4I689_9CAUD|nr:HNH endonuclease [Leuconostoc phage LN04]YP_009044724.1 HNH endonuclease [Leuconostoc phage phiLN12]AFY98256.1 putative HNH endonuclease [Leuconostoc phage LN04]AFY98333.1 putative HNH endonuclease [Leuconostoc phage phiLN12]